MRTRSATPLLVLALLVGGVAPSARADGVDDRRSPVVRAVEKARPGVVSIRTNEIVMVPKYYNWFDYEAVPQERDGALGSGAIFHPQGFVITNAHVIARASKIFVQVTDRTAGEYEREARLVSVDLQNDIAILKMLGRAPGGESASYPWLPLGRSDDLMIGETVIAIGNPFRLGITVTTGIVSALRRSIKPQKAGETTEFRDFVQTDAAINPGNSGGPLLDVTGRWIGVNTAILNRAMGAEGIGFAIPADRVREIVGRAFRRPAARGDGFGFELEAAKEGSPVVRSVAEGGPAGRAGVRRGDRIIELDGAPVTSVFDYRLAEVSLPSGATAHLKLLRARGEVVAVDLTLEPLSTETLARKRLGFVAREVGPEDARTLGATSGIVVTEAVRGTASFKMGLRENDVVTALGGLPMRGLDDFATFLGMVQPGDEVDVTLQRVERDAVGNGVVVGKSGSFKAE